MSSPGAATSSSHTDSPLPTATPLAHAPAAPGWTWLSLLIGATGLGCSVLLWQKVNGMQEQLARQTADASTQAVEARTLAKEAQDVVRDAASKLSVMEARVNEVSLQRTHLEELVRNLSRSRDETLVIDIESAVRLAQQQTQLTGSTEALIATLRTASKRLERAAQPRLIPLQKAIASDIELLRQSTVTDTASLLSRLDDLVRLADDLPLLNAQPLSEHQRQLPRQPSQPLPAHTTLGWSDWLWWQQLPGKLWDGMREEASELLRVSRIDQPDAVLLAPGQDFFLRENLKLKLLNARLAILARQYDAARADIGTAQTTLAKYFSPSARRTHNAQAMLAQLQQHLRDTQLPTLDNTLTALATAASVQ